MVIAAGTFQVVSGGEEAYDEDDGLRLTHAQGEQTFVGDIDGVGSVHWLMVYRPDRTARFVGLQRITGTVGGRRGSFILAADGEHDGTSSRVTWRVVDGSGTGDLAGIAGDGALDAPGGATGTYRLDYTIDR